MTDERIIALRGRALLADRLLNKGLAFSREERDAFGLNGLLPNMVKTLDQQVEAALAFLDGLPTPLARHIRVRTIQDSNETLFYAILDRDLEKALPIIYTPTIGEACQKFSEIWHQPRGLFLSWPERAQMAEILADPAYDDVRIICVTDGEGVLGLGDLGVGGMGIPIGKLSLYTACAGIDPRHALPITLDVGTDNPALLSSTNYIGWKHERVRGAAYDAFIEAFVEAVRARWPNALLHFEDFGAKNASPILERYRDGSCVYNDDIQGTAAVTLGAILAAFEGQGERLGDQRIVMLGGGSAGVGISRLLVQYMVGEGLSETQARGQIHMLDRDGLLTTDSPWMSAGQAEFARRDWAGSSGAGLLEVVQRVHPGILIGVSGVGGLFTEEVVREMAAHCARPIIFPLSNPVSHAEATPRDIMAWTDNRALVSTGSLFPPLRRDGRSVRVDLTNNAYIFPGVGLGVLASGARRVTDRMIMAAANGLAAISPRRQDAEGNLLPPLAEMRETAIAVATAVAMQARAEGVCDEFSDEALRARIESFIWTPHYRRYAAA